MILALSIAALVFTLGFIAGRLDRAVSRVRPLSAKDIFEMLGEPGISADQAARYRARGLL